MGFIKSTPRLHSGRSYLLPENVAKDSSDKKNDEHDEDQHEVGQEQALRLLQPQKLLEFLPLIDSSFGGQGPRTGERDIVFGLTIGLACDLCRTLTNRNRFNRCSLKLNWGDTLVSSAY